MLNSVATRFTFFLPFCVVLASCGETGDAYYAGVDASSYPPADGPGEKLDANEIEAARRITAIIPPSSAQPGGSHRCSIQHMAAHIKPVLSQTPNHGLPATAFPAAPTIPCAGKYIDM